LTPNVLLLLLPGAGYAQMCNVMCEWLEIADVRTSSSKHGSSGGARAAAAGSSSAAAAAGGAAAGDNDGRVPEEFMLLSVSRTSLLSLLSHLKLDICRLVGHCSEAASAAVHCISFKDCGRASHAAK
jgi:hypothetical protein